ncbi:MAG: hypothetical protein Q8859_13730, partial [Bacteroidota bacterium]|nr:hypothetical protein [Bacteroidota bacterium]
MEKKEEVSHNQQYDLVINGKSLAVSLVALRAARKGLRVILYSGEPKRGDGEFDYTQLFPFRISNLLKSKQEYRMIRYLQKMSPHLVIPQRYIAFYQKPPYPSFMLSGIDRIDGNSGENKSLLIRTAKSNDLSAICCDNYPWALTMREYKVDTERLTIGLLKRFRSLGGLIQSGSISNLRQATTGMTFCED